MIQPEILYEDAQLIICYKPAGIATQTKKLGQKDMVSILLNHVAQEGTGQPFHSQLVRGLIPMDEADYLLARDTETPIPGVFAAGDIRKKPLRQVITAAADGAVAAHLAGEFLALEQ